MNLDYLTDWRTICGIGGAILILAEIGRVIYYYIQQKELDREQADAVFKNLAKKKQNLYPFEYHGILFIKGQNKHEALKNYNKTVKEQKLLEKNLDKKNSKSKK